jgi:hypothetical protein
MGGGGKTHHCEGPQMSVAEPWLQSTDKGFLDQDGVQVHRDLGDADPVAPRRNARM